MGLCLAVVVVTNRYEGPPHPEFVPADAYSYLILAQSAPGLPQEMDSFHHAQRIFIPYIVGLIHYVAPIPIHELFRILVLLMAAVILTILAGMLGDLSVHHRQTAFVVAIVAFNPWAFRPYVTSPEMVNDPGFVLGFAIMLRGLLNRNMAAVLLGQLAASASRQTGLLLVPVVAAWLWRDRDQWGRLSASRRLALCLAAAMIAGTVYAATWQVAARLGEADENLEHVTGIASWLATEFDPLVLGGFLARAVMSPLIPLGLLLVAVRGRKTTGRGSNAIPSLLFAGACVSIQPLLAGPELTGGNGPRLVTIGLLPLYVALAIALRDAAVFTTAVGIRRLLAAGVLLFAASLHHWYVFAADPSVTHTTLFAAAYALASVGCLALTAFDVREVSRDVDYGTGAL